MALQSGHLWLLLGRKVNLSGRYGQPHIEPEEGDRMGEIEVEEVVVDDPSHHGPYYGPQKAQEDSLSFGVAG